jgi:hypothetical protein
MIINLEDYQFELGERIFFYEEEKVCDKIPYQFCNILMLIKIPEGVIPLGIKILKSKTSIRPVSES